MTIYRDLEIGEQILPGDRILINNKWLEIKDDDRKIIVDKNTFPVQRKVEFFILNDDCGYSNAILKSPENLYKLCKNVEQVRGLETEMELVEGQSTQYYIDLLENAGVTERSGGGQIYFVSIQKEFGDYYYSI